tara:strand:+ start:401 stop:766 length:366 start_codon:yes stop_codon:yes gene_type:complete
MKKSLLLSALFLVSLSYCNAQYRVQLVQEDSLHRVKLTEFGDDYDRVTTFSKMDIKDARTVRDSLKTIYNSKDEQLEEDLANYLQEIQMLQVQLKEAKSAKNKIERKIKIREEKKVAKANK